MNDAAMVFLALIALGSLVQAVFLVMLALRARRIARRLDEMQERLHGEVRPSIEHLRRVTANLAELSEVAALQTQRIDTLVASTAETIDDTTARVQDAVMRPLSTLGGILPFLKGLQRGMDVYRKLGGLDDAQGRGASRRYRAAAFCSGQRQRGVGNPSREVGRATIRFRRRQEERRGRRRPPGWRGRSSRCPCRP
jgi:hypothetical protein